jgi:hypothetical protein
MFRHLRFAYIMLVWSYYLYHSLWLISDILKIIVMWARFRVVSQFTRQPFILNEFFRNVLNYFKFFFISFALFSFIYYFFLRVKYDPSYIYIILIFMSVWHMIYVSWSRQSTWNLYSWFAHPWIKLYPCFLVYLLFFVVYGSLETNLSLKEEIFLMLILSTMRPKNLWIISKLWH